MGEAEDGEEALYLIKELQPDLVLTDIKMPVMDGLTLIASIQESDLQTPEFIILSGYNEFSYAQRAMRFGVQDFILKPIDAEELVGTLERINRRWTQQEETRFAAQLKIEATLNELLFEQSFDQTPSDVATALGLQEGEPCCYCILERNSCKESDEAVEVHSLRKWKTFINDSLTRFGGGAPIIHDLSPFSFGFILTKRHLTCNETILPSQISTQLLRTVGHEEAATIRIYLGNVVKSPTDIKLSYEAAKEAMLGKYALDDFCVVNKEMVHKASLSFRDLEAVVYSALQEYLEDNNIPGLSNLVSRIESDFKKRAFTADAVLASISKCVMCVLEVLKQIDEDQEPILTSRSIMMQWNQAPKTLSMLMKDLMSFLLESAVYMEQLCKNKTTGTTHKIVYAISENPKGPFVFKGTILTPVMGWTTHHSIVEFQGKWYLFYHDSSLSEGADNKRCVKFTELLYNKDGTILPIDPYKS